MLAHFNEVLLTFIISEIAKCLAVHGVLDFWKYSILFFHLPLTCFTSQFVQIPDRKKKKAATYWGPEDANMYVKTVQC